MGVGVNLNFPWSITSYLISHPLPPSPIIHLFPARNRRDVRRFGGIKKLVRLLKMPAGSKEDRVTICSAGALWSCSKSGKKEQ